MAKQKTTKHITKNRHNDVYIQYKVLGFQKNIFDVDPYGMSSGKKG